MKLPATPPPMPQEERLGRDVIRGFALDAVRLGWEPNKRSLPLEVIAPLNAAVDALPLQEDPTNADVRSSVRAARASSVMLVVVGLAPAGIFVYRMVTDAAINGGHLTGLAFSTVLVLGLVGYTIRTWKRSDRDLWEDAQRSDMRRRATRAVLSAARTVAADNIVMRPQPTDSPMPKGVWFAPRTGLVTPRGAEVLAAEAMRALGCTGVRLTPETRDGGLDVVADGWSAEVKHYGNPVGPQPLRGLSGVASLNRSRTMFFTLTGYTADARAHGERSGMLLFTYAPSTGGLAGHTEATREVLLRGHVD